MAYMEDFDEDWCQCPKCSGYGEVECHCGGDLCVCTNYGSAMCPVCCGEGEISEEDRNIYLEDHHKNTELMQEAWAKIEAERENQPTDGR